MAQSLLFWDYFDRFFFLPQILYPGRRNSGQTMFCNSFLLCSSHGVQTINHSGLTTYNITVVLQTWLIARCHPHSQQCFITHVEEPKGWGEELPLFFGAELTQKSLKHGLHPCVLLIISNLFCYSIFSIKPTDLMATVLVAYMESYSSVCLFPQKDV